MQGPNRKTTSDFVASVAQSGVAASPATSSNKYVAQLNPDGVTFAIMKNGQTLFGKVWWAGAGGPISDANPAGDKIWIWDGAACHVGSAAQFLRNLV